jgi:hypothetical protein
MYKRSDEFHSNLESKIAMHLQSHWWQEMVQPAQNVCDSPRSGCTSRGVSYSPCSSRGYHRASKRKVTPGYEQRRQRDTYNPILHSENLNEGESEPAARKSTHDLQPASLNRSRSSFITIKQQHEAMNRLMRCYKNESAGFKHAVFISPRADSNAVEKQLDESK